LPVHNADIARVFDEIADLLEIGEENPFRVRAYRNAARTLNELRLDVATELGAGRALPKLPGIGPDLDGKIHEIAATGTCALLERLKKQNPPAITELLRLPGLGPKRVRLLHEALGVETIAELRRAIETHRVEEVPGFGTKTAERILDALNRQSGAPQRHLLATAEQYARPFAEHLRKVKGVREVTLAGSFRRMRETVGDIDILVSAADEAAVTAAFCRYPEVKEVLAQGPTRSSVILKSGLQVDLRVVPAASYGAALHYFTGSKAHNIAVRKLGQARGLKINEYGVYQGDRAIAGATEESVFRSVGLPFIPPELREDAGELEAARAGKLPALVRLEDLRGDLHCHTKASDGRHALREMVEAARQGGLAYLAITEHSQRLAMARGLDARRLEEQIAEIEQLNRELATANGRRTGKRAFRVLTGVEVDILDDGALDLPESILARLDVVIAAVHSRFDLPRAKQTARLLRALDHPHVRILAHPSGRLLNEREAYDVDIQRIVRKARDANVALELNAHPQRLDLTDVHCRMAKDEGALVAINSDAHSTFELANLAYGVGQARRGWLEAANVINTRPIAQIEHWLARAGR
jgi:DNA polymerase (family 10)